jgi:phosphoserine phosphatase
MPLVLQSVAMSADFIDTLMRLTGARSTTQRSSHAWHLHGATPHPDIAPLCAKAAVDHAWMPDALRLADIGLMAMDMDSTLITIECIDEIADFAGRKAEVAAITERSMAGEVDFPTSLRERVAVFAGLPEAVLDDVFDARLALQPGAQAMLGALRDAGVRTMLVSGGFTAFTSRLQRELGFDHAHSNTLEVVDGRLTGRVLGDILDGPAKAAHLARVRDTLPASRRGTIAIGDGANDRFMLEAATVGVAFRAKPVLRTAATACLDHVGLEGVIGLFG